MRTAFALAIAGTAFLGLAGAAGAGPCPPGPGDADGRIKFGNDYIGDDDYGLGQVQNFATNPMERNPGTWRVRFENEKPGPRTIELGAGTDGDEDDYKVRFIRGDKNVTDKVFGGTLKFRNVAAGELTNVLKLKIKLRASAQVGDEIDVSVNGRYDNPAACFDTVRAHMELANI